MTVDADERLADAALNAAIIFLASDPRRISKVLRTHTPDQRNWCVLHTERWPCLLHRLAVQARDRLIPTPREATP